MVQVSLEELITVGRGGDRLISMPTDTVPALACRPETAALIYVAKQRSLTKPLILMGHHQDDLWGYVQRDHPAFDHWQQMAFWYWPGALTMVLPASSSLPLAVNSTNPTTIGLRIPNCAITRHILLGTGPLATTSVNRSGQPPLTTIAAINQHFPEVFTLTEAEVARWQDPTCNVMELLDPKPSDTVSRPSPASDPHSTLALALSNVDAADHESGCPGQATDAVRSNGASPSNGTPSTVIRWGEDGWELIRQGSIILPPELLTNDWHL